MFRINKGLVLIAILVAAGLSPLHGSAQEKGSEKPRQEESYEGKSDGYGKTHGLLGPVVLGPAVSLLAFPHPIEVGLEGKYKDLFGFGLTYGFIPDLVIKTAKINTKAFDARVRWFPFRGAFFVGMAFGTQTISAKKSAEIQSIKVNAEVEVQSSFYTPHVGWRWVWPSGYFMGVDLGWQLASGAETTLTTDVRNVLLLATPQYGQLEKDVKDLGNQYGNKPLPMFTLIHFGWLF
ncbi:MAG: hypothetical protein AB1540_02555 [Bdellovibrionota bacterium]